MPPMRMNGFMQACQVIGDNNSERSNVPRGLTRLQHFHGEPPSCG
jgi:hypothetical protein